MPAKYRITTLNFSNQHPTAVILNMKNQKTFTSVAMNLHKNDKLLRQFYQADVARITCLVQLELEQPHHANQP